MKKSSMTLIRIAAGTTSHHKISAIKEACRQMGYGDDIEVVGYPAESGINAQPIDLDETMKGAVNRALQAQKHIPEAELWIGIESGILRSDTYDVSFDIGVIVLIDPQGNRIYATSPGLVVTEPYVDEADERQFAVTTAGQVIAEHLGGDHTDPHHTLTNGRLTRAETLVQGIITALAQLHSPFPPTPVR